jgi:hypothetical protein
MLTKNEAVTILVVAVTIAATLYVNKKFLHAERLWPTT